MSQDLMQLLLSHREAFVAFVQRRVKDAALADELVQAAFVKVLEKGAAPREAEAAVAWFQQVLRNVVADHFRRGGQEVLSDDKDAAPEESHTPDDAPAHICQCMHRVLPTLKAEYADMLRKVDLEERSVKDVAAEAGVTENNAGVRLHRARRALKGALEQVCGGCAANGCLDCGCAKKAAAAADASA
ncbi:RNA polymerase sigma factor [Myxococcus sp. Y35]|uniref:RNA polymerase sigma factor n=1 Tax=Pseudomyxococcus flavus TaxID=3115648 RepID=UPI003CFAB5DC